MGLVSVMRHIVDLLANILALHAVFVPVAPTVLLVKAFARVVSQAFVLDTANVMTEVTVPVNVNVKMVMCLQIVVFRALVVSLTSAMVMVHVTLSQVHALVKNTTQAFHAVCLVLVCLTTFAVIEAFAFGDPRKQVCVNVFLDSLGRNVTKNVLVEA
eukprot:PhF_6_TR7850/c0_g1_i2/m.11451